MAWRWLVRAVPGALPGLVLLAACTPAPPDAPSPPTPSFSVPAPDATGTVPTPAPTVATRPVPTVTERADPRWRFFSADHARHASPWFAGRHRVMIGYGCTRAPYYAHDPRCPGHEGFHHGIDVAMPCGTPLYAGVAGRVVDPGSPGSPGPAYGPYAFRIRSHGVDVLVGHVRRVYVAPGDAVRRGWLIARANDQGAPDGCHLHLEVRRAGGGLADSVDPAPYLRLS